MAAKPTGGSVPAKADVKETETSSITEQETPEVHAKAQTQGSQKVSKEDLESADLDESDIAEIEGKKIPYTRFKEVNEKAKSLEQHLKDSERKHQEDLRRAVEDAEARISQRLAKEREDSSLMEEIDPAQREIRLLKEELQTVRGKVSHLENDTAKSQLQSRIEKLETKYPEADSLAVLAIAKHLQRTSLEDIEELMLDNHSKNVGRAERQVRSIIEQKKQRAKAAIPTREGGIRLKESDRPKTLKEAGQRLKDIFGR